MGGARRSLIATEDCLLPGLKTSHGSRHTRHHPEASKRVSYLSLSLVRTVPSSDSIQATARGSKAVKVSIYLVSMQVSTYKSMGNDEWRSRLQTHTEIENITCVRLLLLCEY